MLRRVAVVLILPCLGACQAPVVSTQPERCTIPLETATQEAALWEACEGVLRNHLFEIDRRDRRMGTITTRPVTSQNIVEVWRRDVATPYDLLEAAIQTVRRSVRVRILPPSDNQVHQLEVAVFKEHYHFVEREVNNAAGGLRVFDQAVPSTLGRRFRVSEDAYWSPAGRDSAYESFLLQKILDRFYEDGEAVGATALPRSARFTATTPDPRPA